MNDETEKSNQKAPQQKPVPPANATPKIPNATDPKLFVYFKKTADMDNLAHAESTNTEERVEK